MNLVSSFLDFALLGAGWVLWLLVALSIVSIAVMVDRWFWFRRRDTNTDEFNAELRNDYDRNELDHLQKKYGDSPAIPVQVALRGLRDRDRGAAAVAESMLAERARWRRAADRNLIVLGTLGNNVPFIGLFGTVLGVIKAFDDLKHTTAGKETMVMAGIAEALVATAIGLLVAVPAVIAYNYFTRQLKVVMSGADESAHTVLALVHGGAPGANAGTEAPVKVTETR